MNHSFDVEIARLHGVAAAILIENFRFWIAKNKANGRHYYDGRWWTYNSTKALSELFPYWSGKQIERTLSRMKSDGIMVTGHYSQNAYDRTNWYSIQEDALPQIGHSISRIREMEDHVFGECTDTDISTDVNTYRESTPRKRSATPLTPASPEPSIEPSLNHPLNTSARKRACRQPAVQCPDGVDQQVWDDWLELRKAKRAPVTQTVIDGAMGEAAKAGMTFEDFLRVWCRRGTQGLEAAWLKPAERKAAATSRHNGFSTMNYNEGISDDGSFV